MTNPSEALDVSSYDDLLVAKSAGRLMLICPVCGTVPVPNSKAPTLSDLTNTALVHLGDRHLAAAAAFAAALA